MLEFMDYIQSAFYAATGWNRDNSYSSLNATTNALLNFPTPRGVRLTLGSLATPQFATAYQLGTVGVVDGSISYLYSTVPLHKAIAQSDRIPLPDLLRSYKPLAELRGATDATKLVDGLEARQKDALAYGRLYLPRSMLEALLVKRFTPALQMQISSVSDQTLRNGGTVLGMVQYDKGRYDIEGLASSDGGLLGIRGLYNFGGDAEKLNAPTAISEDGSHGNGSGNGNGERDMIYGRFSAGAELYYGTLNKSGGMSLGARFATLPSHTGTPLTATMTINPLMGNISWSYAVMAGQHCSLATKLDFNVYSYESDWAIGMELWRKKGAWAAQEEEAVAAVPPRLERSFQAKMEWRLDDPLPALEGLEGLEPLPEPEPTMKRKQERSFQAKLEWRLDDPVEASLPDKSTLTEKLPSPEDKADADEYAGVLKARLDQHMKIGLLWEGRIKSLLFSLGSGVDLRKLDSPFRSLGLEVQFSS